VCKERNVQKIYNVIGAKKAKTPSKNNKIITCGHPYKEADVPSIMITVIERHLL